jgi:hypothetical protein
MASTRDVVQTVHSAVVRPISPMERHSAVLLTVQAAVQRDAVLPVRVMLATMIQESALRLVIKGGECECIRGPQREWQIARTS